MGIARGLFGDFETGIIYGSDFDEPRPSNHPFAQNRRPIPDAYGITYYQNGGFQRVSGLQTEFRHPTSHGLLFDGSYTWMKCLGDVTQTAGADSPFVPPIGTGGFYNRRRFKATCSSETSQAVLLRYVWQLPVGHGQRFLTNSNRFVNGVLGGWRLAGASEFATGGWLTPYYIGVDPSGMSPGVGPQLPDRIGNGHLPRGQR